MLWMLMCWFVPTSGHQQTWWWICRLTGVVSSVGEESIFLSEIKNNSDMYLFCLNSNQQTSDQDQQICLSWIKRFDIHFRGFSDTLTASRGLNTLWPSDAKWSHTVWSAMVQMMVCFLAALSHYKINYYGVIFTWEYISLELLKKLISHLRL